jgi:hypothetical protein
MAYNSIADSADGSQNTMGVFGVPFMSAGLAKNWEVIL